MTYFAYKGREASGTLCEGVIEAADRSEAASRLTEAGLFVRDLEAMHPQEERGLRRFFQRGISSRNLAAATRQLSDLLKGGLALVSALDILTREVTHPALKGTFHHVKLYVDEGQSLSAALQRFPHTFSLLYVSMVATGEDIGRLPVVLESIAERLEADDENRRKIRAAMIYPGILLCVGLITTIFLVTFVVPRLTVIFEDMNQSLPWPTRLLMALSYLVAHYGWLLAPAVVVLFLILRSIGRSQAGLNWWDGVKLRLPIMGRLVRASEVERFARTTATLLRSGISLLVALEVVESTATTRGFKRTIKGFRDGVAEGFRLSEAIRQTPLFSMSAAHVLAIGEDANDPAAALEKIADTQRREVEEATRLVTSLLEPALVIAVGLVIGFVVFAMMLPIFQIDIAGLGS